MTKLEELQIQADKTTRSFMQYLNDLQRFKQLAGLKDVTNVHEICNSMTDKHGRICRHVKHMERKDPKPEWPDEVCESIAGYMAYTLMLINFYGPEVYDKMFPCMLKELEKSIKQHSKGPNAS